MSAAALLAIAQSTVTSQLSLGGSSPDLVLLFVVSWSLLKGVGEGLPVALAGGIVLDALSGTPFGLNVVALALSCVLAGLGGMNVLRTAHYFPFLAIALATPVYYGTLAVLLRLGGYLMPWGASFGRAALSSTVVNGLCMPIVYFFCRALLRRRAVESMEWQ